MGLTLLLHKATSGYDRVPIILTISLILPISFEANPLNLVGKSILSFFRFSCFAFLVVTVWLLVGNPFCFRNKIMLNFVKFKLNLFERVFENLVQRNKLGFIFLNLFFFLFNSLFKLGFLMPLPFQQIIHFCDFLF